MRPGSLAGLVGIDPALHTPFDRETEYGAKGRLRSECALENQRESRPAPAIGVGDHDGNGHQYVGQRHERHHDLGEARDTSDAAEYDESEHGYDGYGS